MNMITRNCEFRAASKTSDGDGRTLEGYAAVFNQDTEINSWEGRFTERIAPGAFKKTLRERKPILQFNHGRDQRTGQVPIGVFTDIREDDHGLPVEARLFENDLVEPIRQAIEGGAITGMSFTFNVVRDEWRDNKGKQVKGDEIYRLLYEPGERGPLQRTIKEVRLFEAGPVVSPAYQGTSVGVRSADDLTEQERQAVAAEYLKSMAETAAEIKGENGPETFGFRGDEAVIDTETIRSWLAAESTWRWLEAENDHRDACTEWLDAEKTHLESDAARKSTSRQDNPERDAARKGTSRREPKKEPEHKAPQTVRTRAVTLTELKEALAIAEARADELDEEFRDAEMPEAEEREYDEAKKDVTTLTARIAKVEARLTEMKGIGTIERGTDSGRGAPRKVEDIYDIKAIRDQAYSDDDFHGLLRDNAMRAAEKAKYSTVVQREAAQEKIEFLLDSVDDDEKTFAKRMLATGSPAYERAWSKALAAGTPQVLSNEEFRSLSLGTDGSGGFAVPVQLDPTVILTSNGVVNPLRAMARVETIVGKEWQGITSAGMSVSRAAEAAEASDNSPTLLNPTVRTNRVHAFVPFSYELEGSWNQMRSELTRMLADGKDTEEATSFVTGDGTGVNANGIVATLSGNTVNAATGQSFTAANVYSLEEALAPRWQPNAQFLSNKVIYNKIRQFDTAGGAQLWERIGAGRPSELLGYSAREASAMASVTTTGTKFLLFGDFSNFLIVDRVGMSVELIPQVFGSNRRPTGQRGIYAIWMNNSKILVDAAFKILVGVA